MKIHEYVVYSDCYALSVDVIQYGLLECVVFSVYDAERDACFSGRKYRFRFLSYNHVNSYLTAFLWKISCENQCVRLAGHMNSFADGESFIFDVNLMENPSHGMRAAGSMFLGEREYLFAPAHSFADVKSWDTDQGGFQKNGRGSQADEWAFHSLVSGEIRFPFLKLNQEFGYFIRKLVVDHNDWSAQRSPGFVTNMIQKSPCVIFKKRSVSACKKYKSVI